MTERSIPLDLVPLASLAQRGRKITYGIVQPGDFVSDGVILVRGRDYSAGWRDEAGFARVTHEIDAPYKRSRLKAGDIVMTIVGANTGTIAVVPAWLEGANITQTTARIAIDPSKASPGYVEQVLRSSVGQEAVYRYQKGGAQPGLNLSDVERFSVPLPRMPEQCKIAAILQTWDYAIDKLTAQRHAKARRLDGLRYAMLFGDLPIGQHRSSWPIRRLGEVMKEQSKRNGKLALDRSAVMGVSNVRGIVPMREQTVSEDISRYKLLPPSGFAYNPMRINVGSIAMNKTSATFLVSPDYVAFTCNPDGLAPDYVDHLRQTRWWLHHINAGGSGSVRQRTYYDDLAALQLRLPDIEEQRAIVAVLNAAAADVELTDREIAALGRQKRGLMQKLLTGEWPVQVEGEAE